MPALEIDGDRVELHEDQDPAGIIARAAQVMVGWTDPATGRADQTRMTGIRLASGKWQGVNWRAVATVVEALEGQPRAGA